MGLKVFFNGKLMNREMATVSIFDHGLLYGDGAFEGIRSYSRRVFRLKEHMDRLFASASAIRLDIGMTKKELSDAVLLTLKANKLDDSYIRVVATRGPGDLGLDPRKCRKATVFIITDKIKLYPEELYENGMPIIISKTRRNHPLCIDPRIKSLNYLNNILAKIEATSAGTEEALMLSVEGYVVECTGDNIFLVKGGRLITPPGELGALEGITQDAVIEIAKKRKIKVERKAMRPGELFKADECFLTGTAAEIIPVVKIDKKRIGSGKPGPVTRMLRQDFHALTKRTGAKY
ncbi:MAG: branched-chain-amino-acid transaminase [Candidatus Omnitrophica bacterium]|nr:branched-chain-amino-acid transaminase [Candidatus Omnitrophota bacterium]